MTRPKKEALSTLSPFIVWKGSRSGRRFWHRPRYIHSPCSHLKCCFCSPLGVHRSHYKKMQLQLTPDISSWEAPELCWCGPEWPGLDVPLHQPLRTRCPSLCWDQPTEKWGRRITVVAGQCVNAVVNPLILCWIQKPRLKPHFLLVSNLSFLLVESFSPFFAVAPDLSELRLFRPNGPGPQWML